MILGPFFQGENGAYFIDRCPKYFGIILNFLRGGVMEKGANVDLKFLRSEAEYFCIQGKISERMSYIDLAIFSRKSCIYGPY